MSTGANHFDFMEASHPSAEETAMGEMLMNSQIPIDEALVRRGVQARVERETMIAVDRARAERKVVAVLTGLQRVVWANLRMAMFTDAFAATMGEKQ